MATEIDQKIVEMRFDNKQFDNGVKETMTLLEKFQASLSFKGATKGMEEIQAAANKIDMSNLEKSANAISVQFDAMQIVAITAIQNITNSVMTLGTQLTKSLTIDQITAGFSKYEDKLVSVRTIMNSTGLSVEEVNSQLNKLNWFTDQTSYNFVDMVSNIGKFTNNSIKLEDAVTAMEGIANWAAISGQGINEAGRAMYNLSQAIAVGSVKLMDWKSIENANMATTEFKQNVIDAAVKLGTLNKVGEKYYTTTKKMEVSATNFNEALSEGWFTSDVLMKVLSQYGEFADEVYNTVQETGRTTESVLSELSAKTDTVGSRAFAAAQEYKTLTDAINATKDAVSTGWMQSFEYIIGNTEQAKEVWTAVGEEIYSIFASGAEYRNEVLKSWAALDEGLGGREDLFNSIGTMWENLRTIAEAAGDAFREVFPQYTVDTISNMVKQFSNFTENIKASESALYTIKTVVKTLLVPFKLLTQVAGQTLSIFGLLAIAAFKIGDSFLSLLSNGKKVESILRSIFGDERYERVSTAFNKILTTIGNTLSRIATKASEAFSAFTFSGKLPATIEKIQTALAPLAGWILDRIVDAIEFIAYTDYTPIFKVGEFIAGVLVTGLGAVASLLPKAVDGIKNVFSIIRSTDPLTILKYVGETLNSVKDSFLSFVDSVLESKSAGVAVEWIGKFVDFLKPLGSALQSVLAKLTPSKILIFSFGTSIVGLTMSMIEAVKAAGGLIGAVENLVSAFASGVQVPAFIQFTTVIGTMVAAIGILSRIEVNNLIKAGIALGAMGASLIAISAAMAVISNKVDTKKFNDAAKGLATMAVAIGVLSVALSFSSNGDWGHMLNQLLVLGAVLMALVLAAKIIAKDKKDVVSGAATIVALSVGIGMIIGALKNLTSIQVDRITQSSGALFLVIVQMAILAGMASDVKFSGAAGLLLLSTSLVSIAKSMQKLGKYDLEDILKGLINFLPIIVVLDSIAIAVRIATKHLAAAGASVIGIAAAVVAMVAAIKILNGVSIADVLKGVGVVAALVVLCTVFTAFTTEAASVFSSDKNGIGKSLTGMATALLILVGVVALFGLMRLDVIAKGIVAVGLLSACMALVVKAGKDSKSAAASIAAMTVALIALTGAIAVLSFLELEEALVAVGTLSTLMVAMAATIKLIGNTKFKIGGLASLIVAVTLLGGLTVILGELDLVPALTTAASISLLMIAMANAIAIMSDKKLDSKADISIDNLLRIGAMMAAIGLLLGFMNSVNVNGTNAIANAAAISIVLLAVSAMVAVLSKMNGVKIDSSIIVTIGVLAGVGAILSIFIAAISQVANENTLNSVLTFASVLGVLVVVSGILAGLSKVLGKIDIASVSNFLGIIAAVAVVFGTVAGIMGAIADDNMTKTIEKGAEVLRSVGMAIGEFFGGIAGGALGAAGYAMITQVGDAIGQFGNAIQPFMDVLGGSGGELFASSVSSVAAAILAITASNVIDGIRRIIPFIGANNSLKDLGEGLAELAPYMLDFIQVITKGGSINTDAIKAAMYSAEALASFANALPPKGGLAQSIFGTTQDMAVFGWNLGQFQEYFIPYCQAIQAAGIDTDAVNAATKSAEALAGFANALPPSGGKWQEWFGEKESLNVFGYELENFGPKFVDFCKLVMAAKIDTSTVNSVTNSAKAIAGLTDGLPERGGKFQDWFGEKETLSEFGENLKKFGPAVANFYTAIKPVGADIIEKSKYVSKAMDALNDGLPKEDPDWVKNIFGGADMGSFASDLKSFGNAFTVFYNSVKSVNFDKLDGMIVSLTHIMDIAERVKLLDTTGLVRLSAGMETLGKNGITSFLNGFSGATEDIDQAAVTFANQFVASLTNNIGDFNDLAIKLAVKFASGINVVGKGYIERAGENFTKFYIDSVSILEQQSMDLGMSVITNFANGLMLMQFEAINAIRGVCEAIITEAQNVFDEHSPSKVFNTIGRFVVQGLMNGMSDEETSAKIVTKNIGTAIIKTFSSIFKIHSPSVVMNEMGHYLVQGLAEGIYSDTSAVDAATQMANNITNAFKSAFDELDLNKTTAELEHQLWTGLYGDTASEDEISEREAALQEKKMQMQAQRVAYANAQYQATLKALGEDATETQKAYNTYLQEMISLTSMAQEIADSQNGAAIDQRQAVQDYIDWMNQNQEVLLGFGYTMEEIKEAGMATTGYRPGGASATKTVEDIVNSYLIAVEDVTIDTDIENAMANAISKTTSAGASSGTYTGLVEGFGEGAAEAIAEITSGESPIATIVSKWFGEDNGFTELLAQNSFMGWLSNIDDDILDKGGAAIENLGTMAKNGLGAFASAWGIDLGTNQSEEFYNIGESAPNSVADGINDPAARAAVDKSVTNVIDSVNNRFRISNTDERNPGRIYGKTYSAGFSSQEREMMRTTTEVLETVVDAATEAAKTDAKEGGEEIGKQVNAGVAAGMSKHLNLVSAAAKQVASTTKFAAMAELAIKSPSRVFKEIGMYVDQGFANGMLDYAHLVSDASESVSETSINSMTDAIQKASEIAGDSLDGDPVIRPILDLDELKKGVREIDTMFTRDQAFAAHADVEANRSAKNKLQNGGEGDEESSSGNTYNFVQNNYSPKSLSRAEIFRQTRNQFAAFKERVSTTK